jgi:signal transduction histidine kinase
MAQDPTFARLVSLACHDLRTPLATVNGFARTLQRTEDLDQPAAEYVEMIVAAAGQLADLLDALGLAAQVEEGRYEPLLVEIDSRAIADAAAAALGADRVGVSGEGTLVLVGERPALRAVSDLTRCALRHGGLDRVELRVTGPQIELGLITPASAPVLLGEQLRDLGAAVASIALRAMGARLELDGELLRITLAVP